MEQTFDDVLVEEMQNLMTSIRQEVKDSYKGKKPFRAVKVSDVERISNYLTRPPEVKAQLQNDMGDMYTQYEQNMENLINQYKGGA